jgi:hypothetical protein
VEFRLGRRFSRTGRTKIVTYDIKRLLRHCESRFAEWRLPTPFDITTLVQLLSRRRRRPIHLVPLALGAGQPSGVSLVLAEMDVVVYDAGTGKVHQEHIIAHELAHIMCGHIGTASLDDEVARVIFPNLDPGLVRDMLHRADYGDEQELEAEIMASVILRRMNTRLECVPPTASAEVREVLDRLEKSFCGNGGSS